MNNYIIQFCPLRANDEVYTLTIGGGTGTAIALNGGAQPFVTEESDDDDPFAPIRTQNGSIRIVDNRKTADGATLAADWWKDLVPVNDTQRPVTLTNGSGTILWQGYMQAQNFGAELYTPTQERDYPVQCCLSTLAATRVSTNENLLCNFAYLLNYIMGTVTGVHSITRYVIQGGNDARTWLLKKVDWYNFQSTDNDGNLKARYNLYEVLEDICRFWGWTARTQGTVMYLTCADDAAEPWYLTLTPTELAALAGGDGSAGTVTSISSSDIIDITGDVYGSTDNDDYKYRGPNKATVKADVNEEDTIVEFAPLSVRKTMEGTPAQWTWKQGEEDLAGYFYTQTIMSFTSNTIDGTAHNTRGGFCRRQIYESQKTDSPYEGDMFLIDNTNVAQPIAEPAISIVTKKALAFGGGSLILNGDVYIEEKPANFTGTVQLYMGLGISPDGVRANARWWYIYYNNNRQIIKGWDTAGTVRYFAGGVSGKQIKSCKLPMSNVDFDAIPIPSELYGFVHVDIYSLLNDFDEVRKFQIGNFAIKFSRDTIDIPANLDVKRPRVILTKRVSTREYTATNNCGTQEEWNADCIFASDNNMEYGHGLLMNADGTFMETVQYGNNAYNQQHPEQHLANRVANYWAQSRRKIAGDYRYSSVPAITPADLIRIDGTVGQPIAISHDWHNDITRISMLEI